MKDDAKKQKVEDQAVSNFREYLRIKTVQPNPDYYGAIEFLKRQASELELPYTVVEPVPGKPVFILTWEGTEPDLTSVMLNSHIDVVPVVAESWTYDPFEAVKTDDGDIYARGTQDMKCVGIQYIEAVRRLKAQDLRFKRTIHMTFVPEEEVGGFLGMVEFLKQDSFKVLNVGFAMDEGLANPTDAFTVFYGERNAWWIEFRCPGNPGHGSRFIENTAAEKFRIIVNKVLDLRKEQEEKLKSNPNLKLGDVISLNLTMLQGGSQHNVVPSELIAGVDIRIPPTVDLVAFEATIAGWCDTAGEGVTFSFKQKGMNQRVTSTEETDPWWKAFSSACKERELKLELEIFPAGTDSRYLRQLGYPAIGFSPMNNTPILLHDHNEFLNEDVFLKGIDIYSAIIPSVANVEKF